MKYKYIYASGKLLIEDDCIAFLEDMSKQGWKLKRVLFSLFIFERCDTPLKYQMDYSDYDKEYVEVIEDLGYEYICLFKEIKFYCNTDLNAVDLQTDPTICELNLLKRYNTFNILYDFVFIFIAYTLMHRDYLLREKMPADFYIDFNKEVMVWCSYVFMIYFILRIIKKADIRYKIKHQNFKKENLICFHPIFKVIQSLLIITILGFIIFLLYFLISPLIFIIVYLIIILISNFNYIILQNQKYSIKKTSKKKRTFVKILTNTLSIIGVCLLIYFFFTKDKPLFINNVDLKPYYEYTDLEIIKETNIYLTQLQFSEEFSYDSTLEIDNYHNEIYYNIKDKKVAQIIFEQIVIDNEFLTNETRIKEADKPIEERKEITHKTYEQAKQHYNQYETSFADICYYYKAQLIAIKDRQILICTLDNPNDINSILNHYFN